jgi:hypothetical protein
MGGTIGSSRVMTSIYFYLGLAPIAPVVTRCREDMRVESSRQVTLAFCGGEDGLGGQFKPAPRVVLLHH